MASEDEGKLHCENRVYHSTHLPQEVTNPNFIQADKNAVQEMIPSPGLNSEKYNGILKKKKKHVCLLAYTNVGRRRGISK